MLIHDMYLEAITRELEENDKALIPTMMYLEDDEYEKLKDELHITVDGKKMKIPHGAKKFTIKMCGTTIEFRSEEWEYNTVH